MIGSGNSTPLYLKTVLVYKKQSKIEFSFHLGLIKPSTTQGKTHRNSVVFSWIYRRTIAYSYASTRLSVHNRRQTCMGRGRGHVPGHWGWLCMIHRMIDHNGRAATCACLWGLKLLLGTCWILNELWTIRYQLGTPQTFLQMLFQPWIRKKTAKFQGSIARQGKYSCVSKKLHGKCGWIPITWVRWVLN